MMAIVDVESDKKIIWQPDTDKLIKIGGFTLGKKLDPAKKSNIYTLEVDNLMLKVHYTNGVIKTWDISRLYNNQ